MRFGLSTLLLAVGGAAILSLWSSPASYTYVYTGRPSDITVIGNGWLYGTDSKTNKRKFFKSCRLSCGQFGELVTTVGHFQVQLEPRIHVVAPTENLRCSPDGRISVLLEESPIFTACGQLGLAVVSCTTSSYVFGDDQLVSSPVIYKANSDTGYIQSGWLLQQESFLDRFKKVSFGELAILVVMCGILIQLLRRPPMRRDFEKALKTSDAP